MRKRRPDQTQEHERLRCLHPQRLERQLEPAVVLFQNEELSGLRRKNHHQYSQLYEGQQSVRRRK